MVLLLAYFFLANNMLRYVVFVQIDMPFLYKIVIYTFFASILKHFTH